MSDTSDESDPRWTLFASVSAAVGAAICCVGPIVFVSLGVTGAWIAELSALETYRPYMMVGAAALLALAFYQVYGSSATSASDDFEACAGPECESNGPSPVQHVMVWAAAVLVLALSASPTLLNTAAGADSGQTHNRHSSAAQPASSSNGANRPLSEATFKVEGITCAGCARALTTALQELDGVRNASVTYKPPEATVHFRKNHVSISDIQHTMKELGYESTHIR
jgi:mercuric ion transport protein